MQQGCGALGSIRHVRRVNLGPIKVNSKRCCGPKPRKAFAKAQHLHERREHRDALRLHGIEHRQFRVV